MAPSRQDQAGRGRCRGHLSLCDTVGTSHLPPANPQHKAHRSGRSDHSDASADAPSWGSRPAGAEIGPAMSLPETSGHVATLSLPNPRCGPPRYRFVARQAPSRQALTFFSVALPSALCHSHTTKQAPLPLAEDGRRPGQLALWPSDGSGQDSLFVAVLSTRLVARSPLPRCRCRRRCGFCWYCGIAQRRRPCIAPPRLGVIRVRLAVSG
ncbi:hypothetical protein B0H67DRAFT_101052 [Lasiosphaeris hirsuta]|uniref:Uncharacterized protein n=1 Tax=Lasiosphaeris hirsuta TaxID=260670 RepID=A0AA40E252_9PEZI|nr:hypothetical protein B0H67DRAFT_101052 [Lasiosphaeris hirsuta]